MGHHIQVIVAPNLIGDSIRRAWPALPRLRSEIGLTIFPVDADAIDQHIKPIVTDRQTHQEFRQLTPAFDDYLRELSRGGILAYLETDYFGGVGGQGGLVYADGVEAMKAEWGEVGPINRALARLGIRHGPKDFDPFSQLGLGVFRDNDDILERIAQEPR